jgi:argininosuccinate lyase
MKKLWQTSQAPDAAIERYTVGDDPRLDARLLKYEAVGSLAHAAGLVKIGLLSKQEFAAIRVELRKLTARGEISISNEQEDIHTFVEQALTKALGPTGAKIHAGRSRNDQVQVDLRLYLKDALLRLASQACAAAEAFAAFGRAHEKTVMPGYTHLQRAMPTTAGHWAASHAEALLEGVRALEFAFTEADACPLGAAAGFGATLPLPRAYVSNLLGFSRLQRNTLRVQTSRPRLEAAVVSSLALVARDLGTLAWDVSLFTSAEFGFFTLDGRFTTGSSIMPQKKNPDVVELTRARAALFPGWVSQILAIAQLPSGYHRDYQLTKGVLFSSVDALEQMLGVVARLPGAISVDAARCRASVTRDMLATHDALTLVKNGTPFREAYRRVADAARAANGAAKQTADYVALPVYAGAPGHPDWRALSSETRAWRRWVSSRRARLDAAWAALA